MQTNEAIQTTLNTVQKTYNIGSSSPCSCPSSEKLQTALKKWVEGSSVASVVWDPLESIGQGGKSVWWAALAHWK